MRRLDRRGRLEIVASQARGVRDRTGVTRAECDQAVWTVAGPPGTATAARVGGARAVALAIAVGRGARWPLVAWRTPLRHLGAPWLLDRVYEFVASNRRRLPGETPWCVANDGACEPDRR